MRIYLAISIVIHALMMLWLLLGPGARALDPARAEPIIVDLVPAQDADPKDKPEQAKSAQSELDQSKTDQSTADQIKADPNKPDPNKPDHSKLAQSKIDPPKPDTKPDASKSKPNAPAPDGKPDPLKTEAAKPDPSDPGTADEKEAEERAATVARLAWLANVPLGPGLSLSGASNGMKANLTGEEVASFKAQIAKCWAAPKGAPRMANVHVVLRIALTPDGRLGDLPLLVDITDGAQNASVALGNRAGQALQECQPYAGLPADRYQDWKVLDVAFTANGPSGMAGPGGSAQP